MITVNQILEQANYWVKKGCKEGTKDHQAILDIYNGSRPLARSYKVKPTDHWCMTFISCLFIQLQAMALIGGTECSCQNGINNCKKAGIWNEDGSIVPEPGDIIFYDWAGTNVKSNNGWADHVGIVEKVEGNKITVIEGNYKDQVAKRVISVGYKFIRGYARPKYAANPDKFPAKPDAVYLQLAHEVIDGKWGNGIKRAEAIRKAGYDPVKVQKMVNKLLA